jgi:hypothetical protein
MAFHKTSSYLLNLEHRQYNSSMILNSVALQDKQFGKEIEMFLANTDRKYWEELVEKFDSIGGKFHRNYLEIRNPFVKGIRQYLYLLERGKSVWKHPSSEIAYLSGQVFMVNRILKHVSEKAKNEIISKLKSKDIRSFLHELTIATHFLRDNFNVDFVEYERPHTIGKTFDFLVSKGSVQAEIECKTKSYDAGRMITRDGFYILCDEIMKQLASYKIKCIIELNCSKHLGQNQTTFIRIVRKLKAAIDSGEQSIFFDEDFSININYLPPEVKINSDKSFASAIQQFLTPRSHFATVSNNKMTIIIKVKSETEDNVLKALYDELKKSLNQFSNERPALIACYIEGIYPEQWDALRTASGLSAITSRLLGKSKASHIHTVAYSSEFEMIKNGHIIDQKYPVLFFKNENCSFYKQQDIFSLSDRKY